MHNPGESDKTKCAAPISPQIEASAEIENTCPSKCASVFGPVVVRLQGFYSKHKFLFNCLFLILGLVDEVSDVVYLASGEACTDKTWWLQFISLIASPMLVLIIYMIFILIDCDDKSFRANLYSLYWLIYGLFCLTGFIITIVSLI